MEAQNVFAESFDIFHQKNNFCSKKPTRSGDESYKRGKSDKSGVKSDKMVIKGDKVIFPWNFITRTSPTVLYEDCSIYRAYRVRSDKVMIFLQLSTFFHSRRIGVYMGYLKEGFVNVLDN